MCEKQIGFAMPFERKEKKGKVGKTFQGHGEAIELVLVPCDDRSTSNDSRRSSSLVSEFNR